MNLLECCLNWRVIAGLGVVGVGLSALVPGVVSAALPLLVFAVCPLSMLLMTKAMQGHQGASAPAKPLRPQGAPASAEVAASKEAPGAVQA